MNTFNTISMSLASFHFHIDYIYTSVCVSVHAHASMHMGIDGKINSLLKIKKYHHKFSKRVISIFV